MNEHRGTAILAGIGIVALVIGVAVYVLDRDPVLVPFFSDVSLYGRWPIVFGTLGQTLPTFAHVFALALLTTALVTPTLWARLAACASWLVVDLTFELAQYEPVARGLGALPDEIFWRATVEPLLNYASRGTFDILDVVSIAVGGAAAAGLVFCLTKHREQRGPRSLPGVVSRTCTAKKGLKQT